ncbi:MAG: UDP-2,3-diacylglucosamine diphosphatase LpxI [Alphaproteobacteria bacterium]|nr:UDP-2,3-diacylglucosamine diphosphatase LpxI [Alphaproteobacteria bacterium]
MVPFEKLGIVAGRGDLPLKLADRAKSMGVDVTILVIKDQADPALYEGLYPHHVIRMGAAQASIDLVRSLGIRDLVFVGAVNRPSLFELRPDKKALTIVGSSLLKLGDDGLLRSVINFLEEKEGLFVHPIHTILDDIMPETGQLGTHAVPDGTQADIEKGRAVLTAMASLDIGQAVVMQNGVVLGVEAAEGTDALIMRCGELRRDGQGPVLVKLSKRQQTERADLPTIGPDTVTAAAKAGFSGIVIQAGRSLLVSKAETIATADKAGLFLLAVTDSEDVS